MNRHSALFLLLVSGCGSRSALVGADFDDRSAGSSVGAGTGGAGGAAQASTVGATASTGTGAGGNGGDGGAIAACGELELSSPVLVVEEPGADLRDPSLAFLSGPEMRLGVFFGRQQIDLPTGTFLQATALDAWSLWPPAQMSPVPLSDPAAIPAVSFAVAPHVVDEGPESCGLVYGDFIGVSFKGGNLDSPFGTVKVSEDNIANADRIVTMRPDANQKWRANVLERTESGSLHLIMLHVSYLGGLSNYFAVGCATTPVALDAAPVDTGWLVGGALGAPPLWDSADLSCASKYPGVGPASTIYLGYLDPNGYPLTTGDVVDVGVPVARLRMAPTTGGAWVAWGTDATPLQIARIDVAAKVTLAPFAPPALVGPGEPQSLDVARLGDDLVVAIAESAPNGSSVIALRRVDPGGSVLWTMAVPTDGSVEGSVSIVARGGQGVLVAWSELPAGAKERRLRLARLTCP